MTCDAFRSLPTLEFFPRPNEVVIKQPVATHVETLKLTIPGINLRVRLRSKARRAESKIDMGQNLSPETLEQDALWVGEPDHFVSIRADQIGEVVLCAVRDEEATDVPAQKRRHIRHQPVHCQNRRRHIHLARDR